MFTAAETSGNSWQAVVNEIQLAINCTTNRVTKASPLELLIGKVARPFGMIVDQDDKEIDISDVRQKAIDNIEINAKYDKSRFDKNKAKIVSFKVGDFVLIKNEERNQTKLDPKFRGPFVVTETLDGNRYTLKSLMGNRTYKYCHENLRKMPESHIPSELDASDDQEVVDQEGNEDSETESETTRGETQH